MKPGYWYFAYSFQQYLWQSKSNPEQGWGIFGSMGFPMATPIPFTKAGIWGSAVRASSPGAIWTFGALATFDMRLARTC